MTKLTALVFIILATALLAIMTCLAEEQGDTNGNALVQMLRTKVKSCSCKSGQAGVFCGSGTTGTTCTTTNSWCCMSAAAGRGQQTYSYYCQSGANLCFVIS
jgi:hypothetical protein